MDAGTILRNARRRSGLSQTELARRAGVTQPTVSAYERGVRDPSLTSLRRLVEATGEDLVVEAVPPKRGEQPTSLDDVRRKRSEIIEACAARGVRNIRIFGSVARREEKPGSDVDLLVDVVSGTSLFDLLQLETELEDMLGCRVDVVPASGLKPRIAPAVLRDAVPL